MKRSVTASLFAMTLLISAGTSAESFKAGIAVAGNIDAEETGIRAYPGATQVDKKGESESANLQFSFGDHGFKLVAAKLRSTDAIEKVAAFYRADLARFGTVLDCGVVESSKSPPQDKKSNVLTCDNDKPRKNGALYKAGRKNDQRMVEIRPHADGSEISLVHVKLRNLN